LPSDDFYKVHLEAFTKSTFLRKPYLSAHVITVKVKHIYLLFYFYLSFILLVFFISVSTVVLLQFKYMKKFCFSFYSLFFILNGYHNLYATCGYQFVGCGTIFQLALFSSALYVFANIFLIYKN